MKIRALLPLLCAVPLHAQVTFTGSNCDSVMGPVDLAVEGPLITGADVDLRVSGFAGSPGFLVGGSALLEPALDLTTTLYTGCFLHVEPTVFVPIVLDESGSATQPVVMWEGGVEVHVQAVVQDGDLTQLEEQHGGVSRAVTIRSLGAAGGLLITEVMKDPDYVSDASGEWFELHNPTDTDVDLEGWSLQDEGGESTVLAGPAGSIVVPAGGYITLGNGATAGESGGIVHAATYTDFVLENGADEIQLWDAEGLLVVELAYDDGIQWPDSIGASMVLDAEYLHEDYMSDPDRWSESECELGGVPYNSDAGTPGVANDECNTLRPPTASGELIFTEVMQNPSAVFDEVGEWFELHNTTAQDIDMQGYTVVIGNAEIVSSSVVVPAGGYALFAKVGDAAANGGLPTPDYVWAPGLFLGNSSELLQVYDDSLGLVCQVSYDNGGDFPDPSGASMSLDPAALDAASSEDGTNWCVGSTPYGDGDLGTPGAANPGCP